jgi:hypothetical protein
MGMFDYFRSSYDLGPDFTEVECQTKDMDRCIGGSMSHFWLDPKGKLWATSYHKTHDFKIIHEDDPRYDSKKKFLNFEWIATGEHGKVYPYLITSYVEVYPSSWNGQWENWPTCRIHFVNGMLESYQTTTKGTYDF